MWCCLVFLLPFSSPTPKQLVLVESTPPGAVLKLQPSLSRDVCFPLPFPRVPRAGHCEREVGKKKPAEREPKTEHSAGGRAGATPPKPPTTSKTGTNTTTTTSQKQRRRERRTSRSAALEKKAALNEAASRGAGQRRRRRRTKVTGGRSNLVFFVLFLEGGSQGRR